MKNLDEVKKYLSHVGHDMDSISKIEGFLMGNGVLDNDFELEFMLGECGFNDFREWFNGENKKPNDNEFGYGDFIHVDDIVGDVLCLSTVLCGKFIGTDGEILSQYELNQASRPCSEKEMDGIVCLLHSHGIDFLFGNDEFAPYMCCKDDSNSIDELEVHSKDAIENIVAAILANEIDKDEREMLVRTMYALIELGTMYE